MSYQDQITEGAHNLLVNCANIKTDEKLLIITERSDLGWYDKETSDFVADYAVKLGITPTRIEVGLPENIKCPDMMKAITEHECTIFFSRIGDQDRFSNPAPGTRSVMCYIRDLDMLASPFGRTNHVAYVELKNAIDNVLINAEKIEITCPLGTNFYGGLSGKSREKQGDVTVHRFPLGVPTPLEAKEFSGRIVMDRYLAPTGSRVYEPPFIKLDEPVFAEIELGRIVDFTGPENTVKQVKEHYKNISTKFGIDPNIVHSWHAGIHPGCDYKIPESDNPDRWSNSVFCSPEFVHFHTCGDYAPGEISCTIPGHTIHIDGKKFWDKGRMQLHSFLPTNECLKKWPCLSDLFEYSLA